MKKKIILCLALTLSYFMISCNNEAKKESDLKDKYTVDYSDDYQLNDRQKNLLDAMGLPDDFSKLDDSQKRSIQRIEHMLSYLEEKYGTEFIYSGYIEKGVNESETLYAYQKDLGSSYTVTVKAVSDYEFTDNYSDASVAKYAENLINGFIEDYLNTDDYRYYARTNACHIEMSEIENADFQWKYGASNIIFIKMDEYDFDELEKFAVNYAEFLYEHQIDGSHRINVMQDWPDYEVGLSNCADWYEEQEYIGSYSFGFINKKTTVATASHRTEVDYRGRANSYDRISIDYSIDEYFAKY